MSDDGKAARPPLTEDRDGPLAEQGWHGGATFFSESGGRPAQAVGEEQEGSRGAGGGDPHVPASESGAGIVPEDADTGGDVHRPASEADSAPLQDEHHGETQSWPGSSFGSIPPPG